jgi:hypothetical protein
MKLFDTDIVRKVRYADYSEPTYKYLNTSDREGLSAIRAMLEEWFSKYPDSERDEFIERFRNNKDSQFYSAFFELLVHELLLRLGYEVDIHPKLKNNPSRPDFLVQSQTGEEFYVEVATFTGMTTEEEAQEKNMNRIIDTINEIKTYNFFIKLNIIKYPKHSISAIKIKESLERELEGLNPDICAAMINTYGFDALPKWRFFDEDFEFEFTPIPKDKQFRTELTSKPIGSISGKVEWMNYKGELKKTLKKKSKYGNLGKPYILALNYLSSFSPYHRIIDTLYGTLNYDTYSNQETPRNNDGVWSSNIISAYRNISGLLFINELYPWATHFQDFKLYLNPWAKIPYNGKLFYFPYMECNNGRIAEHEGSKLSELLE